MDVRVFLLSYGVEVIGKVVEETDDYFIIENPAAIRGIPIPQSNQISIDIGPVGISFEGKVSLGSNRRDGRIKLYKRNICMEILDFNEEIRNTYLSAVSGLEVPRVGTGAGSNKVLENLKL